MGDRLLSKLFTERFNKYNPFVLVPMALQPARGRHINDRGCIRILKVHPRLAHINGNNVYVI